MYLLDQNSQLEVSRGNNKTTNEMLVTVSAIDYNQTTGALVSYLSDIVTSTNGTTPVTICGAPATGNIREVFRIEINNQDSIEDSIELIESVSAVNTIIKNPIQIPVNNSLNYENNEGWYLTDANGNVTTSIGNLLGDVTGPAASNKVVGINGNPLGSTTPTAGNIMVANGSQWVSTTLSGDVSSVSSTGAVVISGVSGGAYKAPVDWSMQTALPSNTYNNGSSGIGATLTATANGQLSFGGVPVSVGNRILVAGEATSTNNGIYMVTQPGSGSSPYILTRATDFNSATTIIPASIIPEVDDATDLQPMAVWTLRLGLGGLPIVVGTSNLLFFRILPNFTEESDGNIFQWNSFNAVGNPMSGDSTITNAGVVSVIGLNGTQMTLEGTTERVFRSALYASNIALTNGASTIAYFVYLGKTVNSITPKFVEGFCITAGSGVTSIEVGLFSSPNPPNKTAQTLTKLTSATVTSFTANTVFRNATAMSTVVNASVQLWAGFRVAFSTTPPTYEGLAADFSEGYIETFASAGAFGSGSNYAGTIPTTATSLAALAPDLRATLD